eukprot:TRINITY_DN1376_c0_g1_i21.p1 TRINITY_DN1376_c0_g1~~TRINITY_DN1376_c0_g1_i21.p1  ORF type:complete len:100 (-),score=31.66 TRINITY_DN1376_c0_g1_i21:73-372(-)
MKERNNKPSINGDNSIIGEGKQWYQRRVRERARNQDMSMQFMNQKSFHPSNQANQRKLWIATELEKERLKNEKLRKAELEKEFERQMNRFKNGVYTILK